MPFMSICSDVVATDTTALGIRQGHFHRGLGLRIDLVLLSEALAPGLERVGIERNYRKGSPKPSDHAPLVATVAAP
jgi:exonuclease III